MSSALVSNNPTRSACHAADPRRLHDHIDLGYTVITVFDPRDRLVSLLTTEATELLAACAGT
jgi:hypothetical protein